MRNVAIIAVVATVALVAIAGVLMLSGSTYRPSPAEQVGAPPRQSKIKKTIVAITEPRPKEEEPLPVRQQWERGRDSAGNSKSPATEQVAEAKPPPDDDLVHKTIATTVRSQLAAISLHITHLNQEKTRQTQRLLSQLNNPSNQAIRDSLVQQHRNEQARIDADISRLIGDQIRLEVQLKSIAERLKQ